ncbi:AimR family lysis-lysogeny pheromone receptor [Neobacillus vireti]|uniref:AimR family lysis-lysogeny pheromone receptor n=1 Tax=Neobacillus vireti TaxID=220686 RepID=UPI002FFFD91C
METLKTVILKKMENERGLSEKLASISGYSSGSAFKKIIVDEGKDIEKLDGFMDVVDYICNEDERLNKEQLILDFTKGLDNNTITIKLLLEYFTLYYRYDHVETIVNKLKASNKKDFEEFGLVYEIQRQVQTKQITPLEGIVELTKYIHSKKIEVRVAAKIFISYCQYDMRNINLLDSYIDEIESEVDKIKNDFLRKSYQGRIFRLRVDINLHTDKIGKLIESLFVIENAPNPTKTMVYLQIGNSYMIKSYEKAMYYFNKAMEYKTIKSENEIKQSINFTSLLWNKLDVFKSDGSLSNDLFYHVRSGNKGKAEETIKQIDFEKLTTSGKAFNCFYRGLLYNDKSLFFKSVEYFISVGEKFYRQLPIMELKKMGEQDYILSALSA